ncbi:MAG: DUF488 domain-containing protein [Dokdonella sp.]|nr:DUF488 domain-containing protein [Dokdonella sp.]
MNARHAPAAPAEWPAGTVFTLGHSTLPIEEFIAVLRGYGVQCLADIRTVPRSRHNPQFNADALAESLPAAGIEYLPLPALGGLRHARKDSPNGGWRNASFRGYADYMQTPAFAAEVDALVERSRVQRIALMCAEAVPWRCHRSLVADALLVRGVPVQEIFSASSCRPHKLTPFAQVDGTRVSYPPDVDATAAP